MYNNICIASKSGITPVILCGPSNVWDCDGHGRNTRRTRSWSCYANFIGVSPQEFMDEVNSHTGGPYQEHWMKNGKWVDDKALIRWAKKMTANACSVENILLFNGMRSANCYVSVWGEKSFGNDSCTAYVKTTEQFDEWICKAKEFIAAQKANGKYAYPHIKFDKEDIISPNFGTSPVYIKGTMGSKGGHAYVEKADNHGVVYCFNQNHAKLFKQSEAKEIINNYLIPHGYDSYCVKASFPAKKFVVKVSDGRETYYVAKVTPKKISFTRIIGNAKAYTTESAANKTTARVGETLIPQGKTVECILYKEA